MDSHYSHGKHSQGEASPTSDRGVSDFIRTAASSYFPGEESEGGAASSPPTHHQSSSFNSGEKMKPSGRQPSGGQAAASAKVLLDAAVAKLHKTQAEGGGEGEEIDNAKLAAAAADVLEAAKHYGKMEGTSYGKYVDMAGGYLQKFGQKQGSGNVAVHDNYGRPPSSHSTQHAQEDDSYGRPHGSGNAAAHDSYARPPSSHSTPHAQEDDDYVRPASSHSASYAEEKEEENQYLKYLKKAEEFLNKN